MMTSLLFLLVVEIQVVEEKNNGETKEEKG